MEHDQERIVSARLELRGQGRIVGLIRQGLKGPLHLSDLEADPRGHDRADRQRCGRRIHDIGQLFAGDLEPVRHGAEGIAADERIGVVVKEDEGSRKPREGLAPGAIGGHAFQNPNNSLCAPAAAHHAHHAPEHQAEDNDGQMICVRQGIEEEIQRSPGTGDGIKAGQDQGPHPHPCEEGEDDLASEQGEANGHKGRHETEPSGLGYGGHQWVSECRRW